jgi:hypothetical protein
MRTVQAAGHRQTPTSGGAPSTANNTPPRSIVQLLCRRRLQVADAAVTGLYLLLEPWLADISDLSPRSTPYCLRHSLSTRASLTPGPLKLLVHNGQCNDRADADLSSISESKKTIAARAAAPASNPVFLGLHRLLFRGRFFTSVAALRQEFRRVSGQDLIREISQLSDRSQRF